MLERETDRQTDRERHRETGTHNSNDTSTVTTKHACLFANLPRQARERKEEREREREREREKRDRRREDNELSLAPQWLCAEDTAAITDKARHTEINNRRSSLVENKEGPMHTRTRTHT